MGPTAVLTRSHLACEGRAEQTLKLWHENLAWLREDRWIPDAQILIDGKASKFPTYMFPSVLLVFEASLALLLGTESPQRSFVKHRCWGWTCSEHSDRGLEEPTGLASGAMARGRKEA